MNVIAELRRRKVIKVGAAYLVGAWVSIQIATTVSPLLDMPGWVPRLVMVLTIAGFPIALAWAWFYAADRIDPAPSEVAGSVVAPGMAASGQAPSSAPNTTARIGSLAVLPLEEIGTENEGLLADGLTEALITDLARASGLKVISRSSVLRFKASTEAPREIARLLGVDALVIGSVRRGGDRFRISVELMDPASERVLWADRYDRDLEDVLRVQDEIAHAIAREVQANVGTAPTGPAQAQRQIVPEAYLLDLKGRRLMDARTEEGFRAALRCFEQALDLDPSYAASYVGIARCHNMLGNYGIEAPAIAHPRAQAAIQRAHELGADAADVHGERAQMRWQFEFDWDGARAECERALALAPSSGRLWYWHGMMLAVSGRFEAGHAALTRAEALDPLSALVQAGHGWAYYFARRYDDALRTLHEVLELNPNLAPAYWFLGMTLVETGNHAGAVAAYESAIARTGRISRLLGYLGHAYGRAGNPDAARTLLAEIQERSRHAYVPPYFEALVHTGLGELDAALSALERGWTLRDCMMRDLLVDASLDRLRDDPRFKALFTAMRYPGQPA